MIWQKMCKEKINLKKKLHSVNQKGFTLLELLSVMVIMSVMASVAIKKFDYIHETTSSNTINLGIRELNTREALVWSQMKLSDSGWSNDEAVYSAVDKNLGTGFSWDPGPSSSGGTLHYKSQSVALDRVASTRASIGSWRHH